MVRNKDEVLSKTFGYGFVNGVQYDDYASSFGYFLLDVIFPTPNWNSKQVIKCTYGINGELLGTNSDIVLNEVPRGTIDIMFYKSEIRNVLTEKKFCK